MSPRRAATGAALLALFLRLGSCSCEPSCPVVAAPAAVPGRGPHALVQLSARTARRREAAEDESSPGPNEGGDAAPDAVRTVLENIALVYVSGRPAFDGALREAVLQYVPMGALYKTWGKVPGNFVNALEYAFEKFPNAQWYYLADDDSFVHLERLAQLAASLNPAEFVFAGRHACGNGMCPWAAPLCQRAQMPRGPAMPGWITGGPGVLLSRSLAEAMARWGCKQYYSRRPLSVTAGDMVLACCVWDAWEGYKILDLADQFVYANATDGLRPGAAAVSVHHLLPETTRDLGMRYNSHLAPRGGRVL